MPFRAATLFHSERLGLDIQEYWPEEVGFDAGLQSAMKQRNELLHAGKTGDWSEIDKNFLRLRYLSERLILRVLDWPDDDIAPLADDDVGYINAE